MLGPGPPSPLPIRKDELQRAVGHSTGRCRPVDEGEGLRGGLGGDGCRQHGVAGGMRDPPLPSAEVDGGGKVYVAWHDCSFRAGCSQNDIVMSTSTDGVSWSSLIRIPIDPVNSTVDHFLPGIGVDKSTSGTGAHIGIGYYYFPDSNCFGSACHLTYGFISSRDGGATWSAPRQASHQMDTSWIASTFPSFTKL